VKGYEGKGFAIRLPNTEMAYLSHSLRASVASDLPIIPVVSGGSMTLDMTCGERLW
jgi:hypothetical protein